MADTPYGDRSPEELILRDILAADRTSLANERTFLAYIRTALTLVIGGISFLQFFPQGIVHVVGWLFIPAGVAAFVVGLLRYLRTRRLLKGMRTHDRR